MLVDDGENLCTATALTRDVVLTAAHCLIGARKRSVKIYQTGETITVRGALPHPQFNPKAYVAARATADLALVKLDKLLPEIVTAAELSPGRPIAFFFSSRRRHTRLTCDWSSDVCSSDLGRVTTGSSRTTTRPRTARRNRRTGRE